MQEIKLSHFSLCSEVHDSHLVLASFHAFFQNVTAILTALVITSVTYSLVTVCVRMTSPAELVISVTEACGTFLTVSDVSVTATLTSVMTPQETVYNVEMILPDPHVVSVLMVRL